METVLNYQDPAKLRAALVRSKDWAVGSPDDPDFAQKVDYEMNRLLALKSYQILGTEATESFVRIVNLTARMFSAPICTISLIDLGRQYFLSQRGLDVNETKRSIAFCNYAIQSEDSVFVVPDTSVDPRFKDNPFVIGKPQIAFYAGKKITSPCGYPLGVLCIIDTKPRPGMTDVEKQNFSDLAEMVMDEFTVRKHDHENRIEERRRILAYTAHDLLTPLTTIQLNVGLLKEDTSKVLNSYQKKLVEDTACCSQFMSDYCHESMNTFRGENNRLRNGEDLTDSGEIAQSIVNLPNLFQEVDVIMKAHMKRVPLTFEISDHIPDFIFSSHLRIVQAALNILSNACKVTQEGFIHAKVYVKKEMKSGQLEKSLAEKDTRDYLYFECLDTGPELKKSAVEEPFFRAPTKDMSASIAACKKSHMRPDNKSRLGIYSVSRHIAILGGRFGYHNSLQTPKGKVFWFSVPLVLPHSDVIEQGSDRVQPKCPGNKAKRRKLDVSRKKHNE